MPYLLYIGFDNSGQLNRRVYYFRYKNLRFKLIQNPRSSKDVLLAVLPDDSKDRVAEVYRTTCEYLSALAWENRWRPMVPISALPSPLPRTAPNVRLKVVNSCSVLHEKASGISG